jgi:hypothetical protein
MITLEQVIYIVPILALTVSILYYALNLRTSNKTQQLQLETRQAQLFMELYREYRDPAFRKMYQEVSEWPWVDNEDFRRKYSPEASIEKYSLYASVMAYFEGIGVLVKRGLLGIDMVYDLLSIQIRSVWEKNREQTYWARKTLDMPQLWDDFEYLYNELMKYIEEHSELKT